jgi:DNA-binding NarL/FixJ family response regulator
MDRRLSGKRHEGYTDGAAEVKAVDQPPRIRVLLADDHAVVREGFAAILSYQQDVEVVGQAADGPEAVALYRKLHPDLLLVDLRMPGLSGVEVITTIRAEDPEARAIVLTTFDGDEDIFRALEAGARGYLLKDSTTTELLDAIRVVHTGGRRVPPEVAARLVERATSGPSLSAREIEVLRLVAAGKTNKEIASALFISEGTVKTHVNSIHEKLGVRDRTEAVMTALRRGILHL